MQLNKCKITKLKINTLLGTEDFFKFCQYLEAKCGIVLQDNKQYLVRSRLTPLLSQFNLSSFSELFLKLFSGLDKELAVAVIDAMTTNETLWFRDGYPFEILANRILPELVKNKNLIKIWSSASSSGQEPYSIAIIVKEMMMKNPSLTAKFSILATDVSSTMLDNCRKGIYDNLALNRGLSPKRKQMFFDSLENDAMKVKDSIRNMVTFRSQNLLASYAALGKFDVIYCRNVLIYFSVEMKAKVIEQMANSLHPGGYLLLGASESLGSSTSEFELLRCNPGIIYRRR